MIASEGFADGLIDGIELELCADRAGIPELQRGYPSASALAASACSCVASAHIGYVTRAGFQAARAMMQRAVEQEPNPEHLDADRIANTAVKQELAQQAALLRDIFGNPFRLLAFESAWRTSDVLALANGIYEEKAFDRMPILADALQDAGCDSEDALNHCRGAGPHVRGCWVVDLILEKV